MHTDFPTVSSENQLGDVFIPVGKLSRTNRKLSLFLKQILLVPVTAFDFNHNIIYFPNCQAIIFEALELWQKLHSLFLYTFSFRDNNFYNKSFTEKIYAV